MTHGEGRATIRSKLLLATSGLAVGACLLTGLLTSVPLRSVALRQAKDGLGALAELTTYNVSAGLDFGMQPSVREGLSGLFRNRAVEFARIVTPSGETFVELGAAPVGELPRIDAGVRETRIIEAEPILIAVTPVRNAQDQWIGTLYLGYSLEQTTELLRVNAYWLLTGMLAIAIISGLVGLDLAKRLTRPLRALTEASRQRAQGRFDEPLDIRSNDEVGELAHSFETMCARLAESRDEVERTNQMLEAKVRERTEELREKNLALEIQNERVVEASRLKSQFLASVSHELRTPLNAILALSELLEDEMCGALTLEQKSHVAMIHRSGEGLLRLINDILDLSKIEAGKLELRLAACDIQTDLMRRAKEMMPLATERGIELRLSISSGPKVLVDSDRICQILLNLLGNAVKFTERGYIEVSSVLDPAAGRLTLSVRDSGIGIPEEQQEAIFQEFRQVDGSPSRKFGGTGLGLAISRRLAEMMGGTIEVESGLGRGSTFTLTLPAATADIEEETAEAPPLAA